MSAALTISFITHTTMVRSLIPVILTTMSLALSSFALAGEEKIKKGFYSYDAMGCMILRECTEGVVEIKSAKDVAKY